MSELRITSERIKRSLSLLKDKIGRHQSEWDVYKTAVNPYEMVYTAPPCVVCPDGLMKHPISRAFYKLWELVQSNAEIKKVIEDPLPKRFAYLAEAPGSFVEAIVTGRQKWSEGSGGDHHVGITLSSERRSIPHWKLQWSWMRHFNVTLCRGRDGTGDITNIANLEDMVNTCGGDGTCDLVTGDGGFDFSSNFNEQESQMIKLLASQVLTASRLLKLDASCIIKVFDAFNSDTKNLIGRFLDQFENYIICKPKTSRPANSERYMICSGYKGGDSGLRRACEDFLSGKSQAFILDVPESVDYIERMNLYHSVAQLECIIDTMDMMDKGNPSPRKDLSFEWMATYMDNITVPIEERIQV